MSGEEPRDPALDDFLDRFRLANDASVDTLAGEVTDDAESFDFASRVEARLSKWSEHPVSITFDPTGRCNVVCEMCDFHRVRSENG